MIRITDILDAYRRTLSALKQPLIWLPLLVYTAVKIGIMFLYFASVRAGVATFWELFVFDEKPGAIIHYPTSHLMMPAIMTGFGFLLEVFVHVIFQGATMVLYAEVFKSRDTTLGAAFGKTMSRYVPLVIVSLVFSVALYTIVHLPSYARDFAPSIPYIAIVAVSAVLGLVVQAFLIFATPFVLFYDRSALAGLRDSLALATRSFAPLFLLVALPFILTTPMLFVQTKALFLIRRLSPDVLVPIQVTTEILQAIGTLLLLGGLTSLFVRRVDLIEKRKR